MKSESNLRASDRLNSESNQSNYYGIVKTFNLNSVLQTKAKNGIFKMDNHNSGHDYRK